MNKEGKVICSKQYRTAVASCIDVNSDQNDEKIAQFPRNEEIKGISDKSDTKNVMRNG